MFKKLLLVNIIGNFCFHSNLNALKTLEHMHKAKARSQAAVVFGLILSGLLLNNEECGISSRFRGVYDEKGTNNCRLSGTQLIKTFGLSLLGGVITYRVFRKSPREFSRMLTRKQ